MSENNIDYSDLVELRRQGRLLPREWHRPDADDRGLTRLREIIEHAGLFDEEGWGLFCDRSRANQSYAVRYAFCLGRAYERWHDDGLRSSEARCDVCDGKGWTGKSPVRSGCVAVTAGQLLRLRQLGPGDEVAPELLPAATVVMGRAGYATKAGTYSWTPQGGWEHQGEPEGDAPNYPLAIAVEVLITAWEHAPAVDLPDAIRCLLGKLEPQTRRAGWRDRLRAQAIRLRQIGRPPDEPLPPWEPGAEADPLSPETLTELGEALAYPDTPSTEGHRRTLIQARRLLDEIHRLKPAPTGDAHV